MIVLRGTEVGDQVQQAHGEVAADEQQRSEEPAGPVRECFGDGQRQQEGDRHRAEHGQPRDAVVDVDRVAQPGETAPAPPEDGEHRHALADPEQAQVVGHQLGGLGDGVDENKVEEQLDGGDAVILVFAHQMQASRGHGASSHVSARPRGLSRTANSRIRTEIMLTATGRVE